jgi:methyl acetate hydrolase
MPVSAVRDLLRAAVAAGEVPGAVAAVCDRDRLLFEVAEGSAGTGHALHPESMFRVASMTKLVTSVAVMMLVERGRIALHEPLARYLPGYRQPPVLERPFVAGEALRTRAAGRDATLAELFTHTSGYGYWFLSPELLAVAGPNASYLEAPFLLHEPGEQFTYGIGTDVAGQLIAPVTGRRLADFFGDEIFVPLDMQSASYRFPADDRLVAVHERVDGQWTQKPTEPETTNPRGGGGLLMTAADYLKLLRMLLNRGRAGGRQLLAGESVDGIVTNRIGALMATPQRTVAPARSSDFTFMDGSQQFGLGVMVETRARAGGRSAGSFAWGGICNTWFWADREAGIAAVLFMQMSPFSDPACVRLLHRFEQLVYAGL